MPLFILLIVMILAFGFSPALGVLAAVLLAIVLIVGWR